MTIELNVAKVLAHSVMLFAKDNWHKDYPSIPWGEPQMCAPSYNAPDLAAANEAAVKAQAETFPKLRALDAAARLGRKITFEGKTYDFSGGENGLPIGDLQIAET